MIIFRCDICGETEDKKSNVFKLRDRTDICDSCLNYLDKAADLLNLPGFKEQLVETYKKFHPGK